MKASLSLLVSLAFLLLPSPAADAGSEREPAADGAEVVSVIYDLAGLRGDGADELQALRLLPFEFTARGHVLGKHRWGVDWYEEESSLAEAFAEFVAEVVAPDEFDYEGRQLELLENDRLLVTAPEALHEQVRGALRAFQAATNRSAQLEIEVFRLAADPAWVWNADPDELVRAGRATLVQRRNLELLVGHTAVQRAQSRRAFVRRWKTEIAQASIASYPKMDELMSGVTWLLRLEDDLANGGYRFRYVQRYTEVVDWATFSPASHDYVFKGESRDRMTMTGLLDQPRVALCSAMGSHRLSVGDSVTMVAMAHTEDGPVSFLTRYHLVSADDPPPPWLYGAGALSIVDASGLFWSAVEAWRFDQVPLWPTHVVDPSLDYAVLPGRDWGRSDPAHERLSWLLEDEGVASFHLGQQGSWIIRAMPPHLLQRGDAVLRLMAPQGPSHSVELALVERDADGGERTAAAVVLPLEASGSALTLVGTASLGVYSWNVDVANASSIPEPIVVGYLDGLSVRAEGAGEGFVDIDLLRHALAERETVDLQSDGVGHIDRLAFDTLRWRRRVASDGEQHRWSDVGSPLGTDRAVDLVVRVTSR